MKKGRVYLVGAGPGDPGLVTLKAVDALKKADVVIYDFLASSSLLEYAKEGTETKYVGKRGGSKYITQKAINDLIIKHAKKGRTVVRLKGGDPFIFGRGGEEALALKKAGITFEVVPGVTSAISAPAYAGIPLTHRDYASSVTFITGEEAPGKKSTVNWKKLSHGDGTLVFLMGWKNLSHIVKRLIKNGRSPRTPVAMVRWGTMTKQKAVVGTLATIVQVAKKADIKAPVVTIVGEVVKLRKKLNWFEEKPLFGKRVLITRTRTQASVFSEIISNLGGEPIELPTIKTVAPRSWAPLDKAAKRLTSPNASYDWAIFTSANGVRYFFDRLPKIGLDLRELKGVKIAAIGPKTEEAIRKLGIKVDLVPKEYVAEAVIKSLGKRRIAGKRFLLPRAEVAREILPKEIKRLGGKIDVVPAYRTVRPAKEARAIVEALEEGTVDTVTFTSSSTVTNFVKAVGKNKLARLTRDVTIAAIGPITARTARKAGLTVHVTPKKYTVRALACALALYYKDL